MICVSSTISTRIPLCLPKNMGCEYIIQSARKVKMYGFSHLRHHHLVYIRRHPASCYSKPTPPCLFTCDVTPLLSCLACLTKIGLTALTIWRVKHVHRGLMNTMGKENPQRRKIKRNVRAFSSFSSIITLPSQSFMASIDDVQFRDD